MTLTREDQARRRREREARAAAQFERFFALPLRRKLIALFVPWTFPVESPAAKLQAAVMAVAFLAAMVGCAAILNHFCYTPKPPARTMSFPL